MAPRKKRPVPKLRKPEDYRAEILAMLDHALENRMDFVLAFEEEDEGVFPRMHAMSGRLITRCMLGTLRNRMDLQLDEGGEYRAFDIEGR